MAHKVDWKSTKTSRLVRLEKYQGPDGKNKYRRHTQKVDYTFPQIVVDSLEDIAPAVSEIVSAGKVGFVSVKQVMDHFNFGMKRSIATAYNRGLDPKLSPAQLEGVNMYAKLVLAGYCERDIAINALRAQQIEDVEAVFDMATERLLNPSMDEDEDSED